ncbi:MAG TPA: LysM peptidoglycan-binding domain-containing protein, partial [Campylobacterales bacterium]|nr:LysM peptidoglycan-binding domain-containing protein [Campylobacterales bacterium]
MEIVKPLKGPNEEEVYNDDFEFREDSVEEKVEEEPNGFKKLYFIVVLMLVAILGYLGFNFLQKNETSQPSTETIVASPINNQKSSVTKEVEAKELSAITSITPAVKKVEEKTTPVTTQEQEKEKSVTTIASVMPKVEKTQEVIPPLATESTKEKLLVKESTKQEAPKQEKVALTQEKSVTKAEPLEIKLTQVKLREAPKPEIKKSKVVKAKPPKAATKKTKVVKKKTPSKKPRIVTVKKGDTLALIAKRYYGNAMEFKHIVRANPKIKSHKTPLKLGQKLLVPYVGKTKTVKKKAARKKPRIVTVKKGDT